MIGLVVVTHGGLAEELVAAARTILGDGDAGLRAVSIGWDDEVSAAHQRILAGIREVDRGEGVVVLTDMFGGTPTNVALSLLRETALEIVTGVNLPMVLKFTNLRQMDDLGECARVLAEKGRSAIQVASVVLAGERRGGDGRG